MSLQVLAGITAVVSWSTLIGKLGHSWIGRHCIEYRYLLDIDNNDNNVLEFSLTVFDILQQCIFTCIKV